MVVAGLVSDKPNAATNNPTRIFNLRTEFRKLAQTFETITGASLLLPFIIHHQTISILLPTKANQDIPLCPPFISILNKAIYSPPASMPKKDIPS
ncbi:MAG: hypothetical protein IPL33_08250 [Sphingobacteriales bacterium]|nr:hypothetical protein [Sphingobacteriales bacterium]MCC7223687.1 hypothetical protein [Chitinophagales bacterium]